MGNTEGLSSETIENVCKSEEIIEDLFEPLAREGFVCELSSGILSALEVLGIASLAIIRVVATNDDSTDEVLDCDNEIIEENWNDFDTI